MTTDNNTNPAAAAPANEASESRDLVAKIVTPEHIAHLSKIAFGSCQQAAKHLVEVGNTCADMGEQMRDLCKQLAEDFEASGQTVAKQVCDFAKEVAARGDQVKTLRASMPKQPARNGADHGR